MTTHAWLLSVFCMLAFAPVLTFSRSSPLRIDPDAGSNVIAATCSKTSDPVLCDGVLRSDPRSRRAVDAEALSIIAVEIAERDARDISSYASGLINRSTDAALRTILTKCSGKYRNAGEALGSAEASLAAHDMDSATVNVAAAREYADTCGRLFREDRLGARYPDELRKREGLLKRLCDVVADIISINLRS